MLAYPLTEERFLVVVREIAFRRAERKLGAGSRRPDKEVAMSVPDPSPGPARPVVTLAAFYGAGEPSLDCGWPSVSGWRSSTGAS
jgi:hypothetical protein